MQNEPEVEIGYILKGFPRISETFIANEIHVLERLGVKLQLFSVKHGEVGKTHGVVSKIQAQLSYVPEVTSLSQTNLLVWLYRNLPKFLRSHVQLSKRRPTAYCKTLLAALRMTFRYRPGRFAVPKKVFIKEFLQAGYIALNVLETGRIRHLHGHFCHGATTITWFVSQMTDIPFSFTAHAKDIYQKKLNPGDLLRRKLASAQFVATCTGANHKQLTQLLPERQIVHTIYHGLDTRFFAPVKRRCDSASTPLILSIGTFVEKKGFPCLIEACARLKQAGINFRCRIVGEAGDQFQQVQQIIRQYELDDTVSLQGSVTQEQLIAIYRQATVFALACQVVGDGDRDGIPNVLVEAMAMGIPVVSTPISGIPELLEDGVNGLLVAERDSVALAGALQRLLGEPELRRQLGAAARKTVCQNFDSHETTAALKDLFVEAIKINGAVVEQPVPGSLLGRPSFGSIAATAEGGRTHGQ